MRNKKYIMRNGIKLWQCTGCLEYLPAEKFYKSKHNPTGITTRCKPCHNRQSIETRDPEKARKVNREYMRRARSTNLDKYRLKEKLSARKRLKNIKTKAREILNYAIASGKIVRPTNCSKCGRIRKVTGHHPDYSKPLEVIWLCYECHANK